MCPCTLKIGFEEKKPNTTCVGLAQENGFFSAKQSCAPVREECKKYDLTAIPYFWLCES
jgi:hypothetical protein